MGDLLMDYMIEAKDLTKKFDNLTDVDGINFKIKNRYVT